MDIDATINRLIHLGRLLEAARHDPDGWKARYGDDEFDVEFVWTNASLSITTDIYAVREDPVPVEILHGDQVMLVTAPLASFGHIGVSYKMGIALDFTHA